MSESVFVKTEEMLKLLGIERKALWTMVKRGKLPKPMNFGNRGNFWFRESIERSLKRMMEESEKNCERGNPYRRKFKTKTSTI